ncbi:MAG: DinB family protein [Ginsengibacter sp.]
MEEQKTDFEVIISNLVNILKKGNAHVSLDNALENIPFNILNKHPGELPYSIWQLAEHIRISQLDILEFSKDSSYQSPIWPDGYWTTSLTVETEEEWQNCVRKIKEDRHSFVELIKNSGDHLLKPFTNGNGQTLFREALVLADHNSYHTGEIIILRRLLNDWD